MKKIIILVLMSFLTLCLVSCDDTKITSGTENIETGPITESDENYFTPTPTIPTTGSNDDNKTPDLPTQNIGTDNDNQTNQPTTNEGTNSNNGNNKPTEQPTENPSTNGPTIDNPTQIGPTIDNSENNPETNLPTIDNSENNPETKLPTIDSGNDNNQDVKYSITNPSYDTRIVSSIDDVTMEDFFNLGNTIDIKVHITSTELNKIQKDYETGLKSEIYRLASKVIITMTNKGTTYRWEYENVGIRQKGNTSRTNIFSGDGGLNKNHYKLSFDETFNDPEMYDASFISKYGNDSYQDREFLGMSGLDFKWNKNYDATHIREVYANYLYRACGILAQHSGLSNLSLIQTDKNNKSSSMGLCTVYEPATKSFIKRSLKSEDSYINMGDWKTEKAGTYGVPDVNYGDLYKCIYGADLTNQSVSGDKVGISNISGSYVPLYDRKTNKEITYNDTLLRTAVSAITSGDYNKISQYVDLEYLAISEAVGYFVGNPDSMRYNTNNFMVYMRRTDGKMVFIPIDSDRCFGITKDWNPRDAYMYTTPLDRKNSNNQNTISLLLNTILSNSNNEAKSLYLEYVNKLSKSEWLTNECFEKFYNMAKLSYSGQSFSLNDDNNNKSFRTYINNKLNTVEKNNNTNNNSGNNNNNPSIQLIDVYLVSTLNNWNATSGYKMTQLDNNTYTITINVTKVESDNEGKFIKFKFNGGGSDYSKIDWTINKDTGKLILSPDKSYRYSNVNVGDVLTITINTATLDVVIEKNK